MKNYKITKNKENMNEELHCIKCKRITKHKCVAISRAKGFIFKCNFCNHRTYRNVKNKK